MSERTQNDILEFLNKCYKQKEWYNKKWNNSDYVDGLIDAIKWFIGEIDDYTELI